ncbi:MAG: amidohydrolase family protein [Verrucomicrobiales bacterium]|nr:amidohydrolase family protein [Verrucomicrobiales bacterium]
MRRIDCHVHLVGDGSSGSGCWFDLRSLYHKLLARVMLKGIGVPTETLKGGMDEAFVVRLAEQVRESSLDAVVLLAQDVPYSDDGVALPEKGGFYVPNDYLLEVCGRHPDLFLPAVSIHPGRPDAMEELEKCLAAGSRVLKLLPNCLNVDPMNPRFRKFWERMAEGGMVLLSHTGGELSLPVMRAEFADPARLRLPLECGVRVIAAHCAGRSGLWDPDYTEGLLRMFEEFPNLYGDNSALCSPVRCGTIGPLMNAGAMERVIHGSDYPIPVGGFGPWRTGHVTWGEWRGAQRNPNVIERDVELKRSIGFSEETFTRMGELLKS